MKISCLRRVIQHTNSNLFSDIELTTPSFLVMVSLSSKLVYLFAFYLTEMLQRFQAVCKLFFKASENVLYKHQ